MSSFDRYIPDRRFVDWRGLDMPAIPHSERGVELARGLGLSTQVLNTNKTTALPEAVRIPIEMKPEIVLDADFSLTIDNEPPCDMSSAGVLAVCTDDGIFARETKTGKIHELKLHDGSSIWSPGGISMLRWSPPGTHVCIIDNEYARILDMKSRIIRDLHIGRIRSVDWTTDSGFAACIGSDCCIVDTRTENPIVSRIHANLTTRAVKHNRESGFIAFGAKDTSFVYDLRNAGIALSERQCEYPVVSHSWYRNVLTVGSRDAVYSGQASGPLKKVYISEGVVGASMKTPERLVVCTKQKLSVLKNGDEDSFYIFIDDAAESMFIANNRMIVCSHEKITLFGTPARPKVVHKTRSWRDPMIR